MTNRHIILQEFCDASPVSVGAAYNDETLQLVRNKERKEIKRRWSKCADISRISSCDRKRGGKYEFLIIWSRYANVIIHRHLNMKLHAFGITLSSTALNYIHPSASPSLSARVSPSRKPMSLLLYRATSTHKSLQMQAPGVCVISNTAPNLFQSPISNPSPSPSGL